MEQILDKIKKIGKMFCKTVHVHTLYCNYNKNLNRMRTMVCTRLVSSAEAPLCITKDHDSKIMNPDRSSWVV